MAVVPRHNARHPPSHGAGSSEPTVPDHLLDLRLRDLSAARHDPDPVGVMDELINNIRKLAEMLIGGRGIATGG
jgi:hypothetical protein